MLFTNFRERLTVKKVRAVFFWTVIPVLLNAAWLLILPLANANEFDLDFWISMTIKVAMVGMLAGASRQKIIRTPGELFVVGAIVAFVGFVSEPGFIAMIREREFDGLGDVLALWDELLVLVMVSSIISGAAAGLKATDEQNPQEETSVVPIAIVALVIVTIIVFFIQQLTN